MSCHEVSSMLSSYIDGEVQSKEAGMIEAHLATCESCRRACSSLRSASALLSELPEIEPPAFLLESIQAATINRPSIWGGLFVMPRTRFAGWAAAGLASAGIIFGALLFQPHHTEQAVRPSSPSSVKTQTADRIKVDEVTPSKTIASADGLSVETARGHRAHRMRNRMIARLVPPTHKSTSPSISGKSSAPDDSTAPVPEAVETPAKATEPVNTAIAPSTPSTPRGEIRITRAESLKIDDRLKQQAVVLEEVRKKVNARYDQQRYNAFDHHDGKIFTVHLASVRF